MSDIKTMIERLQPRQRIEFALGCARRVQHLMRDPRSVAALDTGERWLRGEATDEEMAAATAAAAHAAWSAEHAAWAAKGDAERDAARVAAWSAEHAAWAAAWSAEHAAWAAALTADKDAAWAAAWSAEHAARTAAQSAAAARDDERAWQLAELERMLHEGGGE
jgi:hypothetical protein